MERILVHRYSDGFFTLSANVDGKNISVTYSSNTDVEDAHKDFMEQIKEAKKCRVV